MVTQAIANDTASDIFIQLDPRSIALLLDVDGTLIDIAPSPSEVVVPDFLPAILKQLYEETGGALALVSGRPVRDLDLLFKPEVLPTIGGHGDEIRLRAGKEPERAEDLPADLRRYLAAAATSASGVIVEDKGYSVTLHYRRAPKEVERLRQHIAAARAAYPDCKIEVLDGKAVFEVRRPGGSKGEAVRGLMTRPPFAGRMPVFIGDDITDESVFEVLPSFGGKGFGVGRHFHGESGAFASPADVRRALQQLAAAGR